MSVPASMRLATPKFSGWAEMSQFPDAICQKPKKNLRFSECLEDLLQICWSGC